MTVWASLLQSRFHGLPDRPVKNGHGLTHIDHVYVTGNIAGTPNIKASMNDGYNVGLEIAKTHKPSPYRLQACVGIVGAGPAGIGVAMALEHHNISFVIWEQGQIFQSIASYTEGKQIYARPNEWSLPENLWFEDGPKEKLLKRWESEIFHLKNHIRTHHKVVDIHKYNDVFNVYIEHQSVQSTVKVGVVVLATGTQVQPKKLNIAGESLAQIDHSMHSAKDYQGKRVAVIGGGSSSLEATLTLLKQGTPCTLIHRGDQFSKAAPALVSELKEWKESDLLEIMMTSTVTQFTPFPHSSSTITIAIRNSQTKNTQHIVVDKALVLIGGTPHSALLESIDLKTEQHNNSRLLWWLPFVALVYIFYLFKSGVQESCFTAECLTTAIEAKRHYFPLNLQWFTHLPSLLQVDLGFRVVDGAFWGTLMYSLCITGFGVKAMTKYRSITQRKRYLSLIIFQLIFLFGIPEVIAPWIISTGTGLDFFGGERPWKLYSMVIPWPLSLYSVVDSPSYIEHPNSISIALMWMGFGAAVSFIAIPLYVKKQGQRFCSYLCGCGGLAETLGDAFRTLAPKGDVAKKLEQMGRWVWLLAIFVTGLILNDAWQLIASPALFHAKLFAEKWYSLMVDFWLASVVGVALYPYFGNRVWCRFICPLRAYMETIAKYTTKLSIEANDTCIGCYECTRQCQMGIPVHEFALRQHSLNNQNSACIQCGICIEVCPLDVLSIGEAGTPIRVDTKDLLTPPKEPWSRV